MMSFIFDVIIASIAWYILDNHTQLKPIWKWIIVFTILMVI